MAGAWSVDDPLACSGLRGLEAATVHRGTSDTARGQRGHDESSETIGSGNQENLRRRAVQEPGCRARVGSGYGRDAAGVLSPAARDLAAAAARQVALEESRSPGRRRLL